MGAAKRYDYVIVGGGSAGCAIANRLSADPGTTVLVLEAGHSDWRIDPFIHMPAALPFPIGSRLYDWRYETDPEPELDGRKVFHARGKVLGGSSSINGMIFQRGNPMDYERWAAEPGMKEWDYLHCLPYFKRMENCLAGADQWRGGDGPLKLERGPATNPLFGAFFEAAQQAGYPLTDDVNGYRQEGFARFDRNVYRGRRLSAARAYLHPVQNRKNLSVETLAMVTGVRFDGNRAVGVDYLRGGRLRRSADAGEVILCGGAINTPQLMQLSGIGDEALARPARHPGRAPPPRRGREPAGPPRGLHPVRLQAAGLDRARAQVAPAAGHRLPVAVPPPRSGRDQPLRGRRLRSQQRRRRLPQPDVPLPPRRHSL